MQKEASAILKEFVEEALEKKNIGRVALAASMGLPERSLIGFLDKNRNQIPSVDRAQIIAKALGLEFYIGYPREFKEAPAVDVADDEFILVPEYDVNLAAGDGSINSDNPEVIGNLAFSKYWLNKMGIRPNHASLVRVSGDSMEPTLNDGELVLIDHLRLEQTPGAIFAIEEEGTTLIKRLEWIDGNLLIRSDNPKYSTKIRLGKSINTIRLIGRVVWSARTYSDAYGIQKAP